MTLVASTSRTIDLENASATTPGTYVLLQPPYPPCGIRTRSWCLQGGKWSLVLKGKQQVQIQIQQRKVIDTCMDDASFQCVDLGLSNDDLAIHCTKPAVLRLDPLIPIVCHCVQLLESPAEFVLYNEIPHITLS